MKVAIVTDLHWGVRNNSHFFLKKMEEFYYNTFIPYLDDNNINCVWMLGDFYENRKHINVEVMNRSQEFLRRLNDRGTKVYCLIGNHDCPYRNDNRVNSIIPMASGFENITVIEKFDVIEFDGTRIGFISWINPENREECLNWMREVDAKVLCGHFEINSFEVVKGVQCTSGLKKSTFDNFDYVFSGHFHIRSTDGKITYLGNPYQTNWSEYGYEKGFHVFDTSSYSLEFIKNPVSLFNVMRYDESVDIIKLDIEEYRDKVLRVYVEEVKNRNKLDLLIDRLASVTYSVEVIEDRAIGIDTEVLVEKKDTIKLISEYIDSMDVESIDKDLLRSLSFEIYQEALERVSI